LVIIIASLRAKRDLICFFLVLRLLMKKSVSKTSATSQRVTIYEPANINIMPKAWQQE